jgi:hypothetical protein
MDKQFPKKKKFKDIISHVLNPIWHYSSIAPLKIFYFFNFKLIIFWFFKLFWDVEVKPEF